MNNSQADDIAKTPPCNGQEAAGASVGDTSPLSMGLHRQSSGKTEEKLGEARETLKGVHDAAK